MARIGVSLHESSAFFGSYREKALHVLLHIVAGTLGAARLVRCMLTNGRGLREFFPALSAFVGIGWHKRHSVTWVIVLNYPSPNGRGCTQTLPIRRMRQPRLQEALSSKQTPFQSATFN